MKLHENGLSFLEREKINKNLIKNALKTRVVIKDEPAVAAVFTVKLQLLFCNSKFTNTL